jgi:hypothetical protein
MMPSGWVTCRGLRGSYVGARVLDLGCGTGLITGCRPSVWSRLRLSRECPGRSVEIAPDRSGPLGRPTVSHGGEGLSIRRAISKPPPRARAPVRKRGHPARRRGHRLRAHRGHCRRASGAPRMTDLSGDVALRSQPALSACARTRVPVPEEPPSERGPGIRTQAAGLLSRWSLPAEEGGPHRRLEDDGGAAVPAAP